MANSDKNILITPNVSAATGVYPAIKFNGANNNPITLNVLDDGTVSFSGSSGQLFSVSDSLSGTIFSVNDISGIPSIEVLDTGLTKINQYFGSTVFGASAAIQNSSSVNAKVSISTGFASTPGLIIKAAASQTANLTEWQNSSGTVLAYVEAGGHFAVGNLFSSFGGSATKLGYVTVSGSLPGIIPIVVRSAASQTANLQEWQSSTGSVLSYVDIYGNIAVKSTAATSSNVEYSSPSLYFGSSRWNGSASDTEFFQVYNFRFGGQGAAGAYCLMIKPWNVSTAHLSIAGDSSRSVGVNVQYPSASSGYGQFGVQVANSSYKGIVVRGATSQTGNLQEWQNNSGTVQAKITSDGQYQNQYGITLAANIIVGSNASASGYPVIAIQNVNSAPIANPSNGGILYVESGALKYRGSGGATTIIAESSVADQEGIENSEVQLIQYGAEGSVLQNLPARIHPAEQLLKEAVFWIDPAHSSADQQTIQNLGWGGTALNATSGLNTSVSTDEPKYLSWEGENYIYNTGQTGNYLISSTSASLGLSSDLDMRIKVSLDSLSPSSNQSLISTWWHRLIVVGGGSGCLAMSWQNGSTFISATSTIALSSVTTAGQAIWLRGTLRLNNGAGGYEVKFYTSKDNITWTQLGSTITGGSTTTLGSAGLLVSAEVGSLDSGTADIISGKIYRAQILNGIDGNVVFDCDTSLVSSGATTTFKALTGQTMTIARSTIGRKMVAVTHPLWLFGTDDYFKILDNDLLDFTLNQTFTIFASTRIHPSTAGNMVIVGKGIYGAYSGYTITAGDSFVQTYFAGPSANSSYYYSTAATPSTELRNYFYGRNSSNSFTYVNNNITTADAQNNIMQDTSNSYNLYIGRQENGSYANMELFAVAIWRRDLTSSEISTITRYYEGRAI